MDGTKVDQHLYYIYFKMVAKVVTLVLYIFQSGELNSYDIHLYRQEIIALKFTQIKVA